MDLPAILTQMIFPGLGGLGLFLLGMKNMSEGMQAVAGAGLRRMIGAVTNNRLMATAVGTGVTCLIQSSSITTVMVVGFVNSNFMTLRQAIGVIMGANIGTTITGWILSLDVGSYGLPLLGAAAFVYLFSRADRPRYIAMSVMGVGMVFFGLELMKDSAAVIKDMPDFEAWLQRFTADTYPGVLRCALVGCVVTLVVQSSSATLGMTIALAKVGAINFETAAALVLGENVGTTITAFLASIGATTNARRAAYFHVMFNMIGVAWITALFPWYIDLIRALMDGDVSQAVMVDGQATYPFSTPAIALVHSLFNIANTFAFMPFVGYLATFLERAVPDKPLKDKPHLTSLDIRMLETPVIAIEQSRVEIVRMAEGCDKMMDWLRTLLTEAEPDERMAQKLFHREEVLDTIQDEVTHFMTDLLSANLPHSIIEEGRRQLRLADEYESVSDYIASVLKFHLKLRKQGQSFSDAQRARLLKLHDLVAAYLRLVHQALAQRHPDVITKAHTAGDEIRAYVKDSRRAHLDELTAEKIAPNVSVAFTSALNSYRRVRDHTLNIAEVLAGEK